QSHERHAAVELQLFRGSPEQGPDDADDCFGDRPAQRRPSERCGVRPPSVSLRVAGSAPGRDSKAVTCVLSRFARAVWPVPQPQTLALRAKAVRRLADSKSPQYYDAPYWRDSAHVFAWRKTRSGVDTGHALKDLAVMLEEQSRQPPIDLTIKTDPPPPPAKK